MSNTISAELLAKAIQRAQSLRKRERSSLTWEPHAPPQNVVEDQKPTATQNRMAVRPD